MARRELAFLPGQYYHVYNRGASRGLIFQTGENYRFMLQRLRENLPSCRISVIAYCLMPNHYHFGLRQDGVVPISDLIQAVFNSYSKAYNRATSRSGTLFEGPFRAVSVEKLEHLLHLCRYIHRNPLEAGLVGDPITWEFSNYREWIERRGDGLTDGEFVRENFPQPAEYREFVMDYEPPEKVTIPLKAFLFDK